MAKAYWINLFRAINDPAKLSAYVAGVRPRAAEASGGTGP
jgi:hypothetical protein